MNLWNHVFHSPAASKTNNVLFSVDVDRGLPHIQLAIINNLPEISPWKITVLVAADMMGTVIGVGIVKHKQNLSINLMLLVLTIRFQVAPPVSIVCVCFLWVRVGNIPYIAVHGWNGNAAWSWGASHMKHFLRDHSEEVVISLSSKP